jgi:DnaJ-class molecular chaperone
MPEKEGSEEREIFKETEGTAEGETFGETFSCPECQGSGMAEDGASICPECGGESAMEPEGPTDGGDGSVEATGEEEVQA